MRQLLHQETIRAKRDGGELSPDRIAAFVAGLTDGSVTEGQAAAFAMAVVWRGMTDAETVALTLAMRDSGAALDWDLDGPVLDKHSTGGVGDKTSLVLAPLLAACGAYVPMISGRGLGHTGGTLDKMDAIPGYVSHPDRETFQRVVRETGFAIVGATDDIAPADRRLYAIRDVTATVDSLPLIVASILSKKFAGGARALVMDVKVGSGAFMASLADATALAESLVRVAGGGGLPTVALLTDMDQALGHSAGNALEVHEALALLTGAQADPRLLEVTLALASEALALGSFAPDLAAARRLAEARLADGSAAEFFARGVAALGGPSDLLERPREHLSAAPCVVPVHADRGGVVCEIDVRALGLAVVELGGGRTRPDDLVDHRVGLTDLASIGDVIGADRPLATIHAADQATGQRAAARLRRAMRVADEANPSPAVRGRIAGPGR